MRFNPERVDVRLLEGIYQFCVDRGARCSDYFWSDDDGGIFATLIEDLRRQQLLVEIH